MFLVSVSLIPQAKSRSDLSLVSHGNDQKAELPRAEHYFVAHLHGNVQILIHLDLPLHACADVVHRYVALLRAHRPEGLGILEPRIVKLIA